MPVIQELSNVSGLEANPYDRSDGFVYDSIVVGAGIAGLTAALSMHHLNKTVLVLEASGHLGGALKTYRADGFLVECGPNTVLDTHPEISDLITAAGVTDQQIFAGERAKKRFVVRDGIPRALPTSPGAFVKTPLFSRRAKLRLLREPFVGRADPKVDETVAAFTTRRLGREFLDYAINPFVGGVYAGQPERLSVHHAFPKLAEVEQRYGSLIKGQILGAKERKHRKETSKATARMFSFKDGLDCLPRAIGESMGESIRTRARVIAFESRSGVWEVLYEDGDGRRHRAKAKTVVYAAGLQQTDVLGTIGADTALLEDVDYPPLNVVALGFRTSDVQHPLDGFGLLVPECEKRYLLGALFCSTLFDGRAPEDHVLITAFVGGARAPDLAGKPEDELVARSVDDLRRLLGVMGQPVFQHVTHWQKAIPQYELGYGTVKTHLRNLEERNQGLLFAGNFLSGISVAESIKSGHTAAEQAIQFLAEQEVAS